jgi:RNA polymerase sigma-70 factor (ECF subfamily)
MYGDDHDHPPAGSSPPNNGTGANIGRRRPSTEAMTCAVGSISRAVQPSVEGLDRAVGEKAYGWIVRIIERDGPGILRMLWRILGSEADVMDAYQDCFCKLASRKGKKNPSSAKAYAYRTAANIAIEMIRTRSRRRAHLPAVAADRSTSESDESPAVSPEAATSEKLRDAIAQLPAHLRNVVVLRDLSRVSYAEVGRTLGIDPATARVYRRHAVVRLAELLGEEEGT